MGNSASGLPYDSGAPLEFAGAAHWQLSAGTKKEDKEEKEQVTIFRCLKASSADKLPVALRCLQKLRTLKHPYILTYLDGADMEDAVVLVTEACVPLETWIQQQQQQQQQQSSSESQQARGERSASLAQEVIWGFRCVVNALQFLHSTCSLSHNYLALHSIFVSRSGDFKLGALDLAANLSLPDDASFFNTYNHLLQRPFISPERQQPNAAVTLQGSPGAADMFALAHCIQATFERLKMDVPSSFDKYLQRMLVVDVKRRPTSGQLAQCPIFNSEAVQLLVSLGDLAIKPPSDSLEILGNLATRVPEIPRAVCVYKILPSVSRALQMALNDFPTRNARESCRQSVQLSLSLLAALAAQGKLDEASYVMRCLPVVVQLWSMSDRAIRTTLLKTLKSLVALTPAAFVNKSVFDPMLAGFADSNAKMREDTLKSLVHVVDKLDEKNMQEKLTRCISNLQNDAECSIRTNATIFLGRIAARLKDGVRARVICPAFAKAMRDPFVHCRLAGLKAALACIELLDVPQLTGKIMPQACTLLVDRSGDVREMSLNLLDASTAILRRHHEKTVQSDKAAAAAGAGAGGGNGSGPDGGDRSGSSASWTSWVSDGLSKTIEKATDSVPDARRPAPADPVVAATSSSAKSSSSSSSSSSSTSSSSTSARVVAAGGVAASSRTSSNVSMDNESSFIGQLSAGEADGWGDEDWGDEAASEEGNGWGDDDLELDLDPEEPPKSAGGILGTLGTGTEAVTRSVPSGPASTPVTEEAPGGLGKSSTVLSAAASARAKSAKVKAVVTKINKDEGDKWDDDW